MLKNLFDKYTGRTRPDLNTELMRLVTQSPVQAEQNLAQLDKLLQDGANPDYKGQVGKTPLGEAASFGNHRAVEVLLHHGADPDAVDHWGRTPLGMAQETLQWHRQLPANDPRKTSISASGLMACVSLMQETSRHNREKALVDISFRHTKKVHRIYRQRRNAM